AKVTVTWTDNSANETGFKVWRAFNGSTVLLTTSAAGVTSFVDTTVSQGQTYTYTVQATTSAGDSASAAESVAGREAAPAGVAGGQGEWYTYKVVAANAGGESAAAAVSVAAGVAAPNGVANLTASAATTGATTGRVTLSWSDVSATETGFRVYRAVGAGTYTL